MGGTARSLVVTSFDEVEGGGKMTAYQLHIRNSHYLPPSFSLTHVCKHASCTLLKTCLLPTGKIATQLNMFVLHPHICFFSPFSSILFVSINTQLSRWSLPHLLDFHSPPIFPIFLLSSPSFSLFSHPVIGKDFCFFCQQLSVFRIVSTQNSSLGFFPFSSVRSPPLPLVTTAGTSHSMHPIIQRSLSLLLQCFC